MLSSTKRQKHICVKISASILTLTLKSGSESSMKDLAMELMLLTFICNVLMSSWTPCNKWHGCLNSQSPDTLPHQQLCLAVSNTTAYIFFWVSHCSPKQCRILAQHRFLHNKQHVHFSSIISNKHTGVRKRPHLWQAYRCAAEIAPQLSFLFLYRADLSLHLAFLLSRYINSPDFPEVVPVEHSPDFPEVVPVEH